MSKSSYKEEREEIAAWLKSGSINIFGLPFAGKDTQAQRLAELFDGSVIGGGDILRNQPATPEHVLTTIGKGRLAPSEDYLKIMAPYFSQSAFAGHPLILSSVGRWHGEEEGITQALALANHPLKAVVYLLLDKAVVYERWQASEKITHRGARDDDAPGRLETRFEEFQNKTLAVLDYYRDKKLLIEVDGTHPPNRVTSDILVKLTDFAKAAS